MYILQVESVKIMKLKAEDMKTAPGGLALKIKAQRVCPKFTLKAALDLKTSQPAMGYY